MIYVDDLIGYHPGGWWCHMMSDDPTDEELHYFARRLGLMREWYHGDHYDLRPSKRALAVKYGAEEASTRTLVNIRRHKRKEGLPGNDRRDLTTLEAHAG